MLGRKNTPKPFKENDNHVSSTEPLKYPILWLMGTAWEGMGYGQGEAADARTLDRPRALLHPALPLPHHRPVRPCRQALGPSRGRDLAGLGAPRHPRPLRARPH